MQLPADASFDKAAELAASLPMAVASGSGPLRVDASALQVYDSATIALLMQARRLAQAAGRGFELSGTPPKLTELARLYGVAELLALSSDPSSTSGLRSSGA